MTTKAKSSIKTKADIERHLKRLAGEGSLIALTPKQAKSVKEFVESAEKIGYEQGKSDTLEEVLKDAKKHLEEYDINSKDPYMQGYVEKCKRDINWLEQKLRELSK